MRKVVFILVVVISLSGFGKTRYIDLTEELDSASFVGELVFVGYDSIKVLYEPHSSLGSPGDSTFNIHYAYFVDVKKGDTVKYQPMAHWHNWNYYLERPDEFNKLLKSHGYWPRVGDTYLVVVNKEKKISLFAMLNEEKYIFWDPYQNLSWTTFISFDGPFECLERYESDWNKSASQRLAKRTKRDFGCAFHVRISKEVFWSKVMKS